jgi:hypothetical protein
LGVAEPPPWPMGPKGQNLIFPMALGVAGPPQIIYYYYIYIYKRNH